jgi:hypothetical protein
MTDAVPAGAQRNSAPLQPSPKKDAEVARDSKASNSKRDRGKGEELEGVTSMGTAAGSGSSGGPTGAVVAEPETARQQAPVESRQGHVLPPFSFPPQGWGLFCGGLPSYSFPFQPLSLPMMQQQARKGGTKKKSDSIAEGWDGGRKRGRPRKDEAVQKATSCTSIARLPPVPAAPEAILEVPGRALIQGRLTSLDGAKSFRSAKRDSSNGQGPVPPPPPT